MINFFKNLFSPKQEIEPTPAVEGPKPLSPKEQATANNEPYVSIVSVDIDPNNINNGSFELDWNQKFIINLIRAGYQLKPEDTEDVVIDRWFREICKNILLEVYEQEQADPANRPAELDTRIINRRPLGAGRSEIS